MVRIRQTDTDARGEMICGKRNGRMNRILQGMESIPAKVIEPHRDEGSHGAKYVLIGISVLFLSVMLVLPLVVVAVNALREGWEVYKANIFDEYTIKAFQLTVTAMFFAVAVNTVFGVVAAYLLSKFYFRGRSIIAALIDIPFSISPVIAGLIFILTFGNIGWMDDFLKAHEIKIVFAVPGVILATIFVTFPFVFSGIVSCDECPGKR